VATYASGSLRRGLTHDQAQRAAQILVQKGFLEMKTQMALPGNPTPADEIRRIRVVREAIGPDIKLMCDINQRWRPEQAIDIGSRIEDVGLFWLEDVTAADDYAGLARVTAALAASTSGASCRSAT
jgi:L-alanine-DL-glutamate epimerase-like enolase superfamily enzyme